MEGMEGMEAVAHNPPALKQQLDKAQKRGFSLIEAAIVLGVVGAVIGTIWVSAANMYESWRINQYADAMLSIRKCVQNKFPRLECDYTTLCLPTTDEGYLTETKFFDDIGCIPRDIIVRDNNRYEDVFGGRFVVILYGGRLHPWAKPNTVAQCAKLAHRIARSVTSNELNYIQVGVNVHTNYKSRSLQDWTSYCKNDGRDVILDFKD